MVKRQISIVLLIGLFLSGCGSGGSGGNGGGGAGGGNQQAVQNEIDRLFPFTPNQPFDVIFVCGRSNSQLTYYFDFRSDGSFNVYITLDNGQDVAFSGTYSYANDRIRMVALNNPILPLDETTTDIVPHMGLVGEFTTPIMQCGALGHRENDPRMESFKSYLCPLINIGRVSDEENAFEFVHSAIPFNLTVPGSIFRQKDVHVSGMTNPIVRRGYGIYRRVGDTFYADFGNQFDDHNLLKGTFANGDQKISIEQLEPSAGPCNRR
ncbi:MAG: hypothetical protein LLH30_11210 [Candidatus Manganitrophus sp. SA1]|nr:hypothetical protein [Candidatus Manganitrophus morganii]